MKFELGYLAQPINKRLKLLKYPSIETWANKVHHAVESRRPSRLPGITPVGTEH